MLIRVNRNGRETRVNQKVADILIKRGIVTRADASATPVGATYQTKVMVPAAAVSAPVASAPVASAPAESESQGENQTEAVDDGLEDKDLDELRTLAEERGITVHHRAGKQTVIKALRA